MEQTTQQIEKNKTEHEQKGLFEKESQLNREILDTANEERLILKAPPGISEEVVRLISKDKNEPEWMLQKRLKALEIFKKMPMPKWGPNLDKLDLSKITYYGKSDAEETRNWEDVPDDIKNTFEKLGIPEAERTVLAGVGSQYESTMVYHNLKEEWAKQGVIFENMDVALVEYPELVKEYFMTKCVPITDHKFAALHAAVWSGGTFIYIPKGVKMKIPLQAYFRMNAKGMGQFEHTLIIVDEDAEVHYIEGCFTKGNLVTTNPDYKPIEDINANEKVLTSEGEFKKTKDIQQMPYSGEIYTVEIYGDSTQKIEVTADHPFLYVDRKRQRDRNKIFTPRWNIPKFFKKKDYLCVPINQEIKTKEFYNFEIKKGTGRHGFKKKVIKVPLTNEFFRLVGYYLAEGSISGGYYLNFSFGSHERELIDDAKQCLKKVFGVEKMLEMVHKKNNGTSIVVCNVELARIFKKLGDKCDNKALIPWMMYETKEHQVEIVKGWFRGDGNYYKKRVASEWLKELFRINTTSEKLTRQMRDVLLRLGIVSFINKRNREKEGRKTMYTLGISGDQMLPFSKIVEIPIKEKVNGKRRASMFGINEKFAFLPIKNITKKEVEDLPVYNFGVTDHETFTVGGVAVHNCSAPQYSANSLHAGCVEVYVKRGARARYSSVENWSKNTYNLNTKRAVVDDDGIIEWIGGNMGSGVTMLYPCSILKGKRSKADHISIAFAGKGQNQDTGAKVIQLGEETSSTIKAKSISKDGGITTYRGLLQINKGAVNAKALTVCDALILDKESISNTTPHMEISEDKVDIAHEATTGRISEQKLFYLMSRGLSEEEAMKLVVSGFIEPIVKQLPLEYAVELNRLIELEMEGVG
jgi:Fe-S cluster assembly protein SufB